MIKHQTNLTSFLRQQVTGQECLLVIFICDDTLPGVCISKLFKYFLLVKIFLPPRCIECERGICCRDSDSIVFLSVLLTHCQTVFLQQTLCQNFARSPKIVV